MMHNYNQNNSQQNFNNNNNMRGFSGNNSNTGGWPGNNSNTGGWPGNNSNSGGWSGNNSNSGAWSGNNNSNNDNSARGFLGNNNNSIERFPVNNNNNNMGPFNNNSSNNIGSYLGNIRDLSRNNNNNNIQGFSGNNNSYMGPPFQNNNNNNNNNSGSNSGRGDFWSTMNNDGNENFNRRSVRLNSPPPLPALLSGFLNNLSNAPNLLPFSNSGRDGGGRGRDSRYSPPRRSNSRYSPPRVSNRRNSPPPIRSNRRNSPPPSRSNRRNSPPNRSNRRPSPQRSRNFQRDQPNRPAVKTERSRSNDQNETDPPRNRARQRVEVPPPGEPGGLGDPLRVGLSGAGLRWYIRYLKEGHKPEIARQKAAEHKRVDNSQSDGKDKANLKRSAAGSKPATVVKKPKPDEPKFPMIVLPVDFPDEALEEEELSKLETVIIDEIAKGWDIKPEFDGLYHHSGCLFINCKNEATTKWLEERVPNLESWDGVPLQAFFYSKKLYISFPSSAGQDLDKILALISAQNKDIDTTSWLVLSCKDGDKKKKLMQIVVDSESHKAITEKDNLLKYRFGLIYVSEDEESKDSVRVRWRELKKAKQDTDKNDADEVPEKKRTPMAIIPVDYPSQVLSLDEVQDLESAIVDEIAKGWDIEPDFCAKYARQGRLHIDCADEASVKWLEEIVTNLENWQGVPMKACPAESVPNVHTINITFPNSAGQDVSKTLALVTAQNKEIDTATWRVLKHKDEGTSQAIEFCVDEASLEAIKKKENVLCYRFGRISIYSESNSKGKKSTERQNVKNAAGVKKEDAKESSAKTPAKGVKKEK